MQCCTQMTCANPFSSNVNSAEQYHFQIYGFFVWTTQWGAIASGALLCLFLVSLPHCTLYITCALEVFIWTEVCLDKSFLRQRQQCGFVVGTTLSTRTMASAGRLRWGAAAAGALLCLLMVSSTYFTSLSRRGWRKMEALCISLGQSALRRTKGWTA